ncbi:MAG: sugar transferase [Nitrospiraceae bacterium]|nr:sugar transferase [Nitrospiraceae bacterium]MDA8089025.1 sugar transferase [Nitrospiraceae bacterium]
MKNPFKKFSGKQRMHPRLPYDSICYFVDRDHDIFTESYFREAIMLERRRAARSQKPFFITLLDMGKLAPDGNPNIIQKVAGSLFSNTRDTDIKGWFKYNTIMGVIFTETDISQREMIKQKISGNLNALCGEDAAEKIGISINVFPDDKDSDVLNCEKTAGQSWGSIESYLLENNERKRFSRFIKRVLDITGSLMCMVLASPFFVVIPVLIKLTSKGPVLFRQERVGLHGKPFTFLKFRSMRVNQSDAIHREYVKGLIRGNGGAGAGKNEDEKAGGAKEKEVFKIKHDPRITPVGRFLRKSSLDELPQFFNVLKGEMSFVGPRPPIAYEVNDYDIWHLRRILDVKPGLTGLWQVKGRSSTSFDEMVRLDLQYARTWSLWMDIWIILKTPFVMLTGKGGY